MINKHKSSLIPLFPQRKGRGGPFKQGARGGYRTIRATAKFTDDPCDKLTAHTGYPEYALINWHFINVLAWALLSQRISIVLSRKIGYC